MVLTGVVDGATEVDLGFSSELDGDGCSCYLRTVEKKGERRWSTSVKIAAAAAAHHRGDDGEGDTLAVGHRCRCSVSYVGKGGK
jgi:hypothetical protein